MTLPQTISIFSLHVHIYGLTMAAAIGCLYLCADKAIRTHALDRKLIEDVFFGAIISGFVGARLYHVCTSFTYYWAHPVEVLSVWHGGLSIYGAVIGAVIYFVFYFSRQGNFYESVRYANAIVPYVPFAQAIGRIGNLFNYEVLGYPTDSVFGIFVPERFRPLGFEHFSYFHPWMLYELLVDVCIGLCLVLIAKKVKNQDILGNLFLIYFILYNACRAAIEPIRLGNPLIFGVKQNILVSALLCVIAILVLVCDLYIWKKHRKYAVS